MTKIKADTLSVLSTGSTSVHTYLQLGARMRDDTENYCNLTVRFDRGTQASVCGYPQSWGVWDTNVDYFDSGSPHYSELDPEDRPRYYVDAQTELTFLEAVKQGIRRQSDDPMFRDSVTNEYRKECIEKINRKIKALKRQVKRGNR